MNVRLLIMKLQPAAGQKQLARTLQRAVGEDGLQCCSDESGELLGRPICCYFMGDSCSICRPQLLSTESKLLPSQLVKFLQPSEGSRTDLLINPQPLIGAVPLRTAVHAARLE